MEVYLLTIIIPRTQLTSILKGRGPTKTRPFFLIETRGPHLGHLGTYVRPGSPSSKVAGHGYQGPDSPA